MAAHKKIHRYGLRFSHEWTDLMIELHCFKLKHSEEDGGLGQFGHFKNVVDMLWNRPDSPLNFSWNPWSVRMIEEACVNKNLAVAGCASSSKTMTYALWGMVNWLASPADTMVLMTSTSLKDARKNDGRKKRLVNSLDSKIEESS